MDDQDISSEKITLAIPGNMLAQVDAQIGGGFVDRAEFIRAAIRHYLEDLGAEDAGRQGSVIG
jgi:metal-responsive CopG/Arc/MetJ family transcriptional regulator